MNQGRLAREERLAAKLRENLRRRKAQAREQTDHNDARQDFEPGQATDQQPRQLPDQPRSEPAIQADRKFSSGESHDDSLLDAKTPAEACDIDSPALPKPAPES